MASLIVAGDTSGSVTIAAPAVASTPTLTLPTVSGTILTTASSGQSIPKAALPTGSVLQVISIAKTDTFTTTGTAQTAITGLTAAITPISATSKILIIVSIGGYAQGASQGRFILTRGGSTITGAVGDTAGSRTSDTFTLSGATSGAPQITGGMTYLDSPATTSSTTYGITVSANDAGEVIYINRSNLDSNGAQYQRNISTITVMEIAS